MYSVCVKFKPVTNWRPCCRQFETESECKSFVDAAFEQWKVHHVSVFVDGRFCKCFWLAPKLVAAVRAMAEEFRKNPNKTFDSYASC